jgi:uncharacterized ion transporter superfamily protein YfcC
MKKIKIMLMLIMLMSISTYAVTKKDNVTLDRRVMVDNPNVKKVTKRNDLTDRRIIRNKYKPIKNHKQKVYNPKPKVPKSIRQF